ncbi:hypothetical protein [Phyllobacterium chamaecytisi]|uniref:hypothetical protein n=1 Tax=Phyllobacterium chamaecytisi TaxID=2876082 RepID=UPI001CCAA50F|nr:hypothetical protein [Phyllobacterium sp. KW56]MBZ9600757.1 hypothetical protein [Phyllobacterium sp. KW56]
MKQVRYAALALLVATLPAMGQTVVDDSATGIDEILVIHAVNAVSDAFTDPVSTQFRRLVKKPDGALCGQVNTKNTQGGYVGFKPFKFIPDRQKVYLENTGC